MRIIGTVGIAHSGCNLLKNTTEEVLHGTGFKHIWFSHPKESTGIFKADYGMVKKRFGNLHHLFMNYRNEFDRRLQTSIRGYLGDQKGGAPSSAGGKTLTAQVVTELIEKILHSQKDVDTMESKYTQILSVIDRYRALANQGGFGFTLFTYEDIYENFDLIFDSIKKVGVPLDPKRCRDVANRRSVNNLINVCREEKHRTGNKILPYRMLTNHVSLTKGEPYFWQKHVDFKPIFSNLPDNSKRVFRLVTERHPHRNFTLDDMSKL
jgi:hypothetical protein